MKKIYSLFVVLFFLSVNGYSQTTAEKKTVSAQEIYNSNILVNASTIELRDEMLVKVSDLYLEKNQADLEKFFSTVKGLSLVGICPSLSILKIKIDENVYSNLTDVEHKITDRKIVTQVEFRKGSFSDLDNVCK
ncbi:MAG: hypothetical protein V4667_04920 [Bacteroidota bacterium]